MSRYEICRRIISFQQRGNTTAAQKEIDCAGDVLSEAERAECIGNQFFLAKQFQQAIDYYEHAMTTDTTYDIGRYHYLLAVQSEQAGDFVCAFERYQACIAADPDFPDAYCELGGLLMKVKDYQGAVRYFEEALRLEPMHLGNFQNVAAAYQALASANPEKYSQRFDEAQRQLSRAEKELASLPGGHSW